MLKVLLEITIYSTVIFGAIWLFRFMLKKHLSPAMLYAMWVLMIIRLLMPVTLSAGFSFFVIPAEETTAVQAESVDLTELLGTPDTANISGQSAPQTAETVPAETSQELTLQNTAAESSEVPAAKLQIEITWEMILIALWLMGMVVMLMQMGISSVRLKKRLKSTRSVPAGWQRIIDELRTELRLKRRVRVVMIKGFPSPALSTGVHPVVILPEEMLDKDDDAVRFALLHEMTHIRRGDHIVSLLLLLLRAVYWFNPVVWLMEKQMRLDMETACDSRLVRPMNAADKKRYAGTVLSMYADKQVRYVLGMAIGQTKKTAEQRLRGMFMRGRSSRKGRAITVMAACILLLTCFTTACQPTPEKEIVVGKNQDEMLEAAVQTPDASGSDEQAFSIADMDVPDTYTYSTAGADGKLTVSVDATVTLPDVDMLPTAKVVPGSFSQEMVSGMLDYLFGDTPYYQPDNSMTKDDIQRIILNKQRYISEGEYDDNPEALEEAQQEIEEWQKKLETAPDEREEPKLSDGTMIKDEVKGGYSINVCSIDEDSEYGAGSFMCRNAAEQSESSGGLMARIDESYLYYSDYSSEDDDYYNYTMDGAQRVYSDADIPNDLAARLGVTLMEAKQQVQGMLDAAGVEDMMCTAAFVIDDHGTGHVDDYTGVASDFAFKLFYTRSVNGVPVLPTSEFAQSGGEEYDYLWIYESLQAIVTDGGIVDISWHSPCEVTEMVTDNTKIIDFNEAAEIFEQKIMTFYEAQVDMYDLDSLDIDIDSIELGLFRIKQQDTGTDVAGLYVPVWAFCGAVKKTSTDPTGYTYTGYDHGCDFPDKPYIVLVVNAINGSIIDAAAGY